MNLSIRSITTCCLIIASFLSLNFATGQKAEAQTTPPSIIADSPCDPLYYESLSARAWLEAQREITQNQNLILKPDSVFEYTCFDRLIREIAEHGDEMLSESGSYGGTFSPTSLDRVLENLIGKSLVSYIGKNFGGLRYNLLAGHPAAAGIYHGPTPITNAGTYSCDIMERVWHAAKCINFISNANTDGFYTFKEYAKITAADKRHLPTTCSPITVNWNTNLLRALTTGPWTNDPIQTYFNLTEPTDCSGNDCKCTSPPIPTGIKVLRSGYKNNEYDEYICLQPGCHYHPGGGDDLAIGISDPGPGCYGR